MITIEWFTLSKHNNPIDNNVNLLISLKGIEKKEVKTLKLNEQHTQKATIN